MTPAPWQRSLHPCEERKRGKRQSQACLGGSGLQTTQHRLRRGGLEWPGGVLRGPRSYNLAARDSARKDSRIFGAKARFGNSPETRHSVQNRCDIRSPTTDSDESMARRHGAKRQIALWHVPRPQTPRFLELRMSAELPVRASITRNSVVLPTMRRADASLSTHTHTHTGLCETKWPSSLSAQTWRCLTQRSTTHITTGCWRRGQLRRGCAVAARPCRGQVALRLCDTRERGQTRPAAIAAPRRLRSARGVCPMAARLGDRPRGLRPAGAWPHAAQARTTRTARAHSCTPSGRRARCARKRRQRATRACAEAPALERVRWSAAPAQQRPRGRTSRRRRGRAGCNPRASCARAPAPSTRVG